MWWSVEGISVDVSGDFGFGVSEVWFIKENVVVGNLVLVFLVFESGFIVIDVFCYLGFKIFLD